jgi:hypothetical protein
MNLTVDYIRPRMADDPGDADYMIALSHISGPRWEVPVTKEELGKMQPWIPKALRDIPERK